jgi:tetratricopeptide (TPR) repeat protein/tRNA A-37 threonylcarbamoyl transferase component Bud32
MTAGNGPEAQGADSAKLLELVECFEDAWRQGKRPRLEEFLASTQRHDLEALRLLVSVDLEYRRKAGEDARVDDYLAHYPELAVSGAQGLEMLCSPSALRDAVTLDSRDPKDGGPGHPGSEDRPTGTSRSKPDSLPLSRARRVDDLCKRFESSWKNGERPQMEIYLRDAPESDRKAVLHDLLALDVAYRLAAGEQPTPEEYLRRMPEQRPQIAAAFRDALRGNPQARGEQPTSSFRCPALPVEPTNQVPGTREPIPETLPVETMPGAWGRGAEAECWPLVPGFEILEQIGRGGMGVVYKARQISLDRLVALKMIRDGALAGSEQRARFRLEGEVVARLQHPNIVQIFEVGDFDGHPYCALELIEGASLARALAGRPQPSREAARMLATIARAIHYAHQRGVVHRDLKPSNVLLTTDGRPKVTDIGVAKRLDTDAGHTPAGAILGTPSYMAPEQAGGKGKEVGPLADVYALGAILYVILTGRPPFRAETDLDTVLHVLSEEPLAPSRLQPKVPRDLETICLKSLEKEPRKRYVSAQALAEDLERFVRHEPIQARSVRAPERVWKWARRRPAAAAVLALSLATLVGSAFYTYSFLVWHNRNLQVEVDRALADLNHTRDLLQGSEREAHLNVVRGQVEQSISRARDALEHEEWGNALAHFRDALARIGPEASGTDLEQRARKIRREAEELQKIRKCREAFAQLRDEALFRETLLIGLDAAANWKETRKAAEDALRLFDVALVTGGAPAFPAAYLGARERNDLLEGCYELLLVCAETAGHPRPGQAPDRQAAEALRILDRAAGVGIPPTRAYYLRRARYLKQAGDEAGARREHALADRLVPAGVFDQYLSAQESYRQGDLPRAIHEFEQILGSKPDHYWAHYFLAVCYLKTSYPDLALANLSFCRANARPFFWGYLLQGQSHDEQGEAAAALADYQEALGRARDGFERYGVFVNRGALGVRRARSLAVAVSLPQVALLAPPFSLCRCLGELAHLQREQWLADAIADLREAVRLRPEAYQAHVNMAWAYEEQGKGREAAHQLDQALRCEPGECSLYRERALLHVRDGKLIEALSDFDSAIRLQPPEGASRTLAEYHVERASVLFQLGRYDDAVRSCDAALALWPDYVDAHRWRGEALLNAKRYRDAVTELDHYIEKGKPSAVVYRARALARAKLGDHAGAMDDYTRSLQLAPDAATYAQRGWLFLEIHGAPHLALADFESALRREPTRADYFNGRGSALVQLNEYRRGVADAEEALRLGPKTPHLLYTAARVYAKAAGRVALDARQTDWDRKALRVRYEEHALGLIRSALAVVPPGQRAIFWHRYIELDRALDALRQSPGFIRLLAVYSVQTSRESDVAR